MRYHLDPRHPNRMQSFVGLHVRLPADITKCVAFIGIASPEPGQFEPAGTVFLLAYKSGSYIVTARHVAERIGDTPFAIRLNKRGGGSAIEYLDPIEVGLIWHFHDDDTIDLAIMPVDPGLSGPERDLDIQHLHQQLFVTPEQLLSQEIGIGDPCYTVGLFQKFPGDNRNLPTVHGGNIALLPSPDRIPSEDPRDPSKRITVEGYLVEAMNLSGLSGSPVFVRPTLFVGPQIDRIGRPRMFAMPAGDIALLGVWSGSWEGPASADYGRGAARVPVGMGIVVPTAKLIELLEAPLLQKLRPEYDPS